MRAVIRNLAGLFVPALMLVFLGVVARPAVAAEAGNGVSQPSMLDAGSFLQMFMALGLVIVIIIGLSFAVRKFNMFTAGPSRHIRIVGGLALSNKDRLLLVQVGDEQLLISASPGSVRKVHQMRTPIDEDTVVTSKTASAGSFANLLQTVTQRGRS